DLALFQGIRTLPEAGAAPRLTNLPTHGPQDRCDRLAVQTRFRVFDVALDAAGSGEDDELLGHRFKAVLPAGPDHQRRRAQVAVPAVGARPDEGLIEGELLERHLVGGKRIPRG